MTAEFISSRSGDVTVGVSSEAKQLNTWRVSDYSPEYRKTQSIGKRKLLTPDARKGCFTGSDAGQRRARPREK